MKAKNINECDNTTKRYYHFVIMLFPQEQIVKEKVVCCTERQMHEESFRIVKGLEEAGLAYNGKNANHHFGLMIKELPSPEKLAAMIAAVTK